MQCLVPGAGWRRCSSDRNRDHELAGGRTDDERAGGAAGILPPGNPPANIAPSSGDWLTSIDGARAQEGVGQMNVSESQLAGLPIDQQLFTVVNDERVDRGLPPIDYLTSQLDSYARPEPTPAPTRRSRPLDRRRPDHVRRLGLGRRLTSVLEADYYWMYDDG